MVPPSWRSTAIQRGTKPRRAGVCGEKDYAQGEGEVLAHDAHGFVWQFLMFRAVHLQGGRYRFDHREEM